VSAGESSGELYGAELVRHLRSDVRELDVFGLGGDRLREQGARLVAHVRELAVVGLLEVVRHLRRLRGVFRQVLDDVERQPPDLAVLIDYPDFNLRLARALRERGVRVVYYVSPQLWAWRKGRIRTMRKTVERVLVIFPFEEELYRNAGIPVTFVGHPLVDLVQPVADRAGALASLGLRPERPVVAVLPGSRPQEVSHNLPPLAGALKRLLAQRPDVQIVLAVAPALDAAALSAPLAGLPIHAVKGQTTRVLGAATLGLVASGTATVEAALVGTPIVVVYRLSAWTYALGRPFVKVPHFAMVNLIAGRTVVPERIQRDFTPERVAADAVALLEDAERRAEVKASLAEVRVRLGRPGASARAARAVLEALQNEKKLDKTLSSM
jgi:lipid-A-disaccharide synthase